MDNFAADLGDPGPDRIITYDNTSYAILEQPFRRLAAVIKSPLLPYVNNG